MKNYLNFETEVKELEAKLENLKDPYNNEGISEVNTNEIASLEDKINKKLKKFILTLILGKQHKLLDMRIAQSKILYRKFISRLCVIIW